MGHLREAGVDYLIIHREGKHMAEVKLKRRLPNLSRLTVHVSDLRGLRGIHLALKARRTEQTHTGFAYALPDVLEEFEFIFQTDVLDHINRKRRIEAHLSVE